MIDTMIGVGTTGAIMKISRNGQISLPAETRRRWGVDHVVVVDLGDQVIVAPVEDPENPRKGLYGKYAGPGPTTDELRRMTKEDDEASDRRKFGAP